MTDEIDAKSNNQSPNDSTPKDQSPNDSAPKDQSPKDDGTFDPAREDETKVMLESLEPAASPGKAEVQPLPVPVVKKKTGSEKPKEACGSGPFGCVSRFALAVCKAPGRTYAAYRAIKSTKVRRSVALGVGLLVGIGAFFVWPGAGQDVSADPRKESCEFLARPAARLYIDGKLASKEVPPIHRVRLDVGRHTVRFVSPENRTHKASFVVVRGKPTQWFMNFIDNKLDERSLISEREEK